MQEKEKQKKRNNIVIKGLEKKEKSMEEVEKELMFWGKEFEIQKIRKN